MSYLIPTGDVTPPEPSTFTKIAGPLAIAGVIYWIWAGKPTRTRSTYRGSRR